MFKDVWPFTLVVGSILACSTLIFWGFNEDSTQGFQDQLFSTYGLLYGSFDPTVFTTPSERILLAVTLFLLPVVLLNLLVSILGGTFGDCQEKKVFTSNQTQIEYILEYITVVRMLLPNSVDNEPKGYLISCGPKLSEEHKELEQNEKLSKSYDEIREEISQIKEEMDKRMREVVAEVTKIHTEIRSEIAKNHLEVKSHLEAENRSEIRSAKNHVEVMRRSKSTEAE